MDNSLLETIRAMQQGLLDRHERESVPNIRAFSFGGGVQSMAALVLSARGVIDFPLHLFSNVGNDSEHPATIRYLHDVAMPYAEQHGIELCEVFPTRRGEPMTLYETVLHSDLRGMPIPLRDVNGAPGIRACTKNFKIVPIARELKRRGATPESPATLGMGISLDEFERMRSDSPIKWQVFDYPLIALRMTRDQCEQVIRDAGMPVPPKSSCWFCPFHRPSVWRTMKTQEPDLFMNAVVFEYDINAKRARLGLPPNYLSRMGKPLDQAFDGEQAMMDFDDTCESGYCLT